MAAAILFSSDGIYSAAEAGANASGGQMPEGYEEGTETAIPGENGQQGEGAENVLEQPEAVINGTETGIETKDPVAGIMEEDVLTYLEQFIEISGIQLDMDADYAVLAAGETIGLPSYKLSYKDMDPKTLFGTKLPKENAAGTGDPVGTEAVKPQDTKETNRSDAVDPEGLQAAEPEGTEEKQITDPEGLQSAASQDNSKTQAADQQDIEKTESAASQDTEKAESTEAQDAEKSQVPEFRDTEKAKSAETQGTEKVRATDRQDTEKAQAANRQDTEKVRAAASQDTEKAQTAEPQDIEKAQAAEPQDIEKVQAAASLDTEETKDGDLQDKNSEQDHKTDTGTFSQTDDISGMVRAYLESLNAEETEALIQKAQTRVGEKTEVILTSDSPNILVNQEEKTITAVAPGPAVIRMAAAGHEELFAEYRVIVKPSAPQAAALAKADPQNHNTIALAWKVSAGASGYEILRRAEGETTDTLLADLGNADSSAYTDTGIKTGVSYTYRVKAYADYQDHAGTKQRVYAEESNALTAKTEPEGAKIKSITAKSYNSIKLEWNQVKGADSYEIYRSAGASKSFKRVGAVKENVLAYTDQDLKTGTVYNYKIRGVVTQNGGKTYGAFSSVKSMTAAPPAPVLAIEKTSYNKIELTWKKTSGASGYDLYRKTEGGSYKKISTFKGNSKLSYQDKNVKTGTTYYYKVRAYKTVNDKKVYGAYSKVSEAVPSLSKPKLSLTEGTYNGVKLGWKKISGADGYVIYQKKGNGSYTRLKTISKNSTTGYTVGKLTAGVQYTYKVRAYRNVDGKKVYSSYSAEKKRIMVPSAPELKASGAGADAVKLSWDKVKLPSKNSGYYVYQVTADGEKLLKTRSASTRSYTVSGLKLGEKYRFKVVAYMKDSKGRVIMGENSDTVTASPKLLTPAVSSVKAGGYDNMKITWKPTAKNDEDTYIIYRATSKSGKYKEVGRVARKNGKTSYSFTDKKLSIGKTYYYKIRSLKTVTGKGKYYSSYSSVKSGKTVPAAPEVTVASKSYNSMKISWKKVKGSNKSGYVDGYEIYRSTSKNGSYKKVKTITSGKTTSYTDTKLSTGKTYYYKMRAYSKVKGKKLYGAYSSVKSAKVEPGKVNLKKVSSAGYNSAKLSWDKVSGVSGYKIYRSTSKNGRYTAVKTVKSGSTVSYTDSKLTTGKKYYFKVRAYRSVNGKNIYGKYSDIKSVTPQLAVPKNLKATPENINQIRLTWDKVSGAEYYVVLRSVSKNGTYSVINKKCKKNYYTNTLLENGNKYYYKVYAVRKSYKSKETEAVSAKAGVFIITNRDLSIQVGDTIKADVIISPSAAIKWSSKNSNIASVNSAGEIRGNSEGTTKIIGKANGITSEINLTVKRTINGIDVSKWQGNINFNAVKASGVDFVMIRIYNGYTQDPYFEQNYANAKAAGLKVGVYAYSVAGSYAQAQREAWTVLNILNGRHLDFPIAMDVEDNAMLGGGLSNTDRTNMIFDFRNIVVTGGYRFLLYANTYWLENYIENHRLDGIDIWVARYRDLGMGHGYTGGGNVTMWQYSSKGSVNGINGNVDMNICYSSY